MTNPLVVQAGLARQQALQNANAALRQSRSQDLIRFGDPALARSLGNTVDPNTAGAAQANQYSILANLAHQNELAGRGILNSLGGRGLIHSGDLGYLQGEQARSYGQQRYNATQDLLDRLNQQLSGYLGQTQSAQDVYTQALLQAFGQFGQNPLGLL